MIGATIAVNRRSRNRQLIKNASVASEWANRFSALLGEELPEISGAAAEKAADVEILTPEEMASVETHTITAGTPGIELMKRAGAAVAELARQRVPAGGKIVVLAGPGNNGGDGFIAASILVNAGYPVRVALSTDRGNLSGDAAIAASGWGGPIDEFAPAIINGARLIVDALFGAGLARPIEGRIAGVIAAVNESDVPVVAVDLPSGIDGRNGNVLGIAVKATDTVTFFRRKPGHLLMPGRLFGGRISVADIGIEAAALEVVAPKTFHNTPEYWQEKYPQLRIDGHKYDRGHAIVVSGPMIRTGAARLAARGALRIGAGLVTVASPRDALAVHAAHLTSIMILKMDSPVELRAILSDERRNAVVLGPALGVDEKTRQLVEATLGMKQAVVLDADAIAAYFGRAEPLFELIMKRDGQTVLTPHDGEFSRIFPDLVLMPSKLDRARAAAVRSRAVIVSKGADTVVAAPDGRAVIADNGPPELATAGSGDVLAGMICGLLAQRMPAFEAAAAAVWMHGAAARVKGRGLIAEDIPEALPEVVSEIADAGPEQFGD